MSSQGPSAAYGQTIQQWRLELFGIISRVASVGGSLAIIVYTILYVLSRHWPALVVAGLIALVLGLLQVGKGMARRRKPEQGITLFAFSLIGFLVISFYFQSGLIGFYVVALIVPLVVSHHLLDPGAARRVTIASALAIIHNIAIAFLNPLGLPSLPLPAALAINLLLAPAPLAIIALVNSRAAGRAEHAITRLEQQSTALEETVRRRTSQLTAAAEIGRAASSLFDLPELLNRTLALIRDRFGYYHASVFLLDESGLNAVVAESTGEIGRILKERRHTLAVGSQSIIGYVTAQRKSRVALDVGQDAVHFKNPLLPETRSELAIPLVAGDRLLGALDVQSKEPNAFTAADVSVLQTLADQLAVAIRNAELFSAQERLLKDNERLLVESRQAIEELNALTGRLSREGWQEFIAAGGGRVSATSHTGEAPALPEPGDALGLAVQKRDLVSVSDEQRSALAAPIMLRDQIIGALAIEEIRPDHRWTADDLALAQEVADRLGLALDNARLLEQVNRERERLSFLYESARALTASLRQTDILNTTLSFALRVGAQHAIVLLIDDPAPGHHTLRASIPGLENLAGDKARTLTQLFMSQGLVQWVIENQQAAVVRDSRDDPRWLADLGDTPIRSILIAPLRSQGSFAAGALVYTHSLPGAFAEDQFPLIESISAQVSVALNNARLYQEVETQRSSAAALAHATQIMVRSLSEAELLQSLADQLFDIFHPDGVVVYRWDADDASLTPAAAHFDPDDPYPWPPLDEGFPAEKRADLLAVIQSRKGRIARLRDEPEGKVRESMSLPFVFNDQAEGAVEIVHTGPASGLTAGDLGLFESLLASAGFALQTVRLYQQVLDTAERLREVDRLKSQFLANMSHELRTPLNSIIGFSRVIMKGIDGPVTDVQLQDLSAIHGSGQHLLGLINDILDLSRIEAGKMELNFDRVDITDIVKGVMSTTIGLVKDKAIRLVSDIQPNLPPVHADAIRLRQILLNLMSNAAKFTEEGAITVRAWVLEREGQQPMVEVSVKDSGIGIPERDLPKLFQTFSQVDGSATRKVGGSGLGLSISKNLIELHGGMIWVDSKVGAGSTFHFTIPVHVEKPIFPIELPEEGAAAEAVSTMAAAPANGNGFHMRSILAIDDDARLIDLYRRYLEPRGFTLHGLINPKEAVAAARALDPEVILLDVMMPDHDGWQVLKDLKGHADTRAIPIIVCSILTEQDKARRMGAVDYLTKPILDVDLIAAINRLVSQEPAHPVAT